MRLPGALIENRFLLQANPRYAPGVLSELFTICLARYKLLIIISVMIIIGMPNGAEWVKTKKLCAMRYAIDNDQMAVNSAQCQCTSFAKAIMVERQGI